MLAALSEGSGAAQDAADDGVDLLKDRPQSPESGGWWPPRCWPRSRRMAAARSLVTRPATSGVDCRTTARSERRARSATAWAGRARRSSRAVERREPLVEPVEAVADPPEVRGEGAGVDQPGIDRMRPRSRRRTRRGREARANRSLRTCRTSWSARSVVARRPSADRPRAPPPRSEPPGRSGSGARPGVPTPCRPVRPVARPARLAARRGRERIESQWSRSSGSSRSASSLERRISSRKRLARLSGSSRRRDRELVLERPGPRPRRKRGRAMCWTRASRSVRGVAISGSPSRRGASRSATIHAAAQSSTRRCGDRRHRRPGLGDVPQTWHRRGGNDPGRFEHGEHRASPRRTARSQYGSDKRWYRHQNSSRLIPRPGRPGSIWARTIVERRDERLHRQDSRRAGQGSSATSALKAIRTRTRCPSDRVPPAVHRATAERSTPTRSARSC